MVRHLRRLLTAAMTSAAVAGIGPACADIPSFSAQSLNPGGKAAAEKLMADAQKALKAGNYRLALIDLKNAVAADPHNGMAHAQLGIALLQTNDPPTAERELREARRDGAPDAVVLPSLFETMLVRNEGSQLLDQFPDPGPGAKAPIAADILKARALALQAAKKLPDALDAMDRSLAIRRDSQGLLTRARLSIMQGAQSDAFKFADEAIAKSTSPEAMLFKTGLLLSANQNAAALALTDQILTKYPGNLQGRFARVEALLALKQDAKAKHEVDDIVLKYPSAYLGTYYRAVLLARAGNAAAAWNFAQSLPADFRDSQPRVAVMVAQMAVDSGNEETGVSILERLLVHSPSMPVVRVRLAALRLKQNNPSQALGVLEPIKDSSDLRVLELLSDSYTQLHRYDDALAVLRRMDAMGKGRTDFKRGIAMIEIQMGRNEDGIRDLSQLAAREPANPSLVAPLIDALAKARRFPEALAVADRMAADPKQRATALIYRGNLLVNQGDNAGAQAAFDKAVKSDPRSTEALYARASFLSNAQRFAEANRDLRAVLVLDGSNMTAMLKLAEIAARQGQDQDVRSVLAQAIAKVPDSAAPRTVLARYLIAKNDFKGGLAAGNDLLKLQPKNAEAFTLIGQAQFALGQKKEAIATYRRLITLMPTAAGPQVLLGNALAATGDRAGAARALETAAKLSPESPEVKGAQINQLLTQNRNDEALAAARAFQASYPGAIADSLLADTLDRAKLTQQAVAVLDKSYSDHPNGAVLLRLVRFAIRANDRPHAAELMSGWLARNPGDMAMRLEYGTLLMQMNNNAAATAQYQQVLKQDPNDIVALNNLGWMLQGSDPKRALALLTQAMKLSPNSADVADTLGWMKVQQKDLAGGLALLNRAHAIQPRDGGITYHLVLALDANSKRDQARGLLKQLLDSKVDFKDRPDAVKLASAWKI
ncbi:MAG TPA: XrtA/PEP-CTERM system TPR-repeat protein PrsT [Rhizomicrobium sp.]|nr:XrtA/PEP-CTERM system TPR-repeat protein PrsT [Rhizomicrobium sp.]